MYLKHLHLQNFRSYTKSEFTFNKGATIIVGPNTAGKTNLIEAISLLSRGKSFRTEKDVQAIQFTKELARVKGELINDDKVLLEIVLTTGLVNNVSAQTKKYLVNGVAKRRVDFAAHLPSVIFSPVDLAILIGSPTLRRDFFDDVLEQVDREYLLSHISYTKALRQRNSLLERAREEGKRNEKEFAFWDALLIKHGQLLTKKRDEFVHFCNNANKSIFDFAILYDKSIISKERLLQYKDAEMGAGVTLVGPHRDDFSIQMHTNGNSANASEFVDMKFFGSRGQQRLSIVQLKALQLLFVKERLGTWPLFLLDDIFSELDAAHISLVHELIGTQQTIITTTHKEFIGKKALKEASVIELE